MSNPGVGQRLKRGFGWGMIGTAGWRLLSAVSSIFVARILSPTGFGELGIVRSTANMFTVYAGFRLGTTASKHVAQYRESNPGRAARILKLSLVMSGVFCALAALILLFGASYLAREVLDNETLVLPLRLSSVFLFFQAYSSVRETVLVGTESFKAFAIVNIIKGILIFCFIIPGAYYWGVLGAVSALGLAAICSYIVLSYYVKKSLSDFNIGEAVPFSEWKRELPLLWTFALPGILGGVLTVTMIWVGKVLLVDSQDGYTNLGLFEAANQWRTAILFIPGIFSRVAMPIISETFERDPDKDFILATGMQFNVILAVTLPLTIIVILFSPLLIMFFGAAYSAALPIMPVLMASVFFFALNQSLRKVQDGTSRRWQNFAMYILWAVSFYIVALALVGDHGALGLAYAYLASEIVLFISQAIYVELRVARHTLMPIVHILIFSILIIILAMYVSELAASTVFFIVSGALMIGSLLPILNMYMNHRKPNVG